MGSIEQVEMVKVAKKMLLKDNGIMVVDPVLGDNGKLYAHFDNNFVSILYQLSIDNKNKANLQDSIGIFCYT